MRCTKLDKQRPYVRRWRRYCVGIPVSRKVCLFIAIRPIAEQTCCETCLRARVLIERKWVALTPNGVSRRPPNSRGYVTKISRYRVDWPWRQEIRMYQRSELALFTLIGGLFAIFQTTDSGDNNEQYAITRALDGIVRATKPSVSGASGARCEIYQMLFITLYSSTW